ncbi:MAG: NADH-quinone oxidoreductase subunit J [Myxococcota bacterium]|nr:NADH-quinone oxidoreductase subunit J [Myxococcota bacterium]
MMLEAVAFYAFACLAIVSSGFLLVEGRTPLSASIALAIFGFSVAGLIQSLGADLLAILQWLLSLASVAVLFVASLTVSGLAEEEFNLPPASRVMVKLLGVVAAVCLAGILAWIVGGSFGELAGEAELPGSQAVAISLYSGWASPLHLLGLLLLVVLVGSVVLAKQRLD